MKRNIDYSLLFVSLLFVVLLPSPSSADTYDTFLESFLVRTPVLPKDEIRAAWVVRFALSSREDVDRAIDYAVRARFQMLFVQIRGRGDAYYESSIEPEGRTLGQPISEFDPFGYLLRRAHETGIAVHAWVNVFYVWSDPDNTPPPGHMVREHPEWLVVDRQGVRMDKRPLQRWQQNGVAGYFVSPGISGVRRHTTEVIREIVSRYAVDGVHLDYFRYPGSGFDFSDLQRTAFMLEFGVDPMEFLGDGSPDSSWVTEQAIVGFLDSLFIDWRSAQVDSLVGSIRSTIGDSPLSVAVLPDAERARVEIGQNWVKWIQDGLVDFVVPMAYSYEPAELLSVVRTIRRTIGVERFLVGLPVFDGRERYLGYSVSLLRQEGVLGYSLFSYNELEKDPFSVQFLERVFLGSQEAPDREESDEGEMPHEGRELRENVEPREDGESHEGIGPHESEAPPECEESCIDEGHRRHENPRGD